VTVDDHPSFEDLSAYHDGEAPALAAHVQACPACLDTVAALSSLSAAVAGPDAGHTWADADDERAAPSPAAVPPPRPTPLPQRSRWLVAAVAAAAVVMIAAGLTAVLRQSNPSDSTTAAGRPPSNELSQSEAPVGGPAPAADSAMTAVVGGDLGDIPDPATLLAKVGPLLSSGRSAAGEGGARAPAAPPVRPSVSGVADAPEPRVVGTRPCEIEARAGQPALGDVLYVANAKSAGTPAVVLAFAPASGVGRVTVAMLATPDCRLLFQATTP
jgi:hypothetical protein